MTESRSYNPKEEAIKADIKPLLNPWVPEKDPINAKIQGKALEELGEAVSAIARSFIQGIEESEPVSGKPNRLWVMEEMADVYATFRHVLERFNLDNKFIVARTNKKYDQLQTWFYEMK